MGAIDNVYGVHDIMQYVFFPLALLSVVLLSFALVMSIREKLYPAFPANCFLAVMLLKICYGTWLTLFRWMPEGPLYPYLAYPGNDVGCHVASFVDSLLQMLILAVNTTQMTMIFYTLYLGVVLGAAQKKQVMRVAAKSSIGVCLVIALTVFAERSTSEMAWCIPGKIGTVAKDNLCFLMLIAQVIMVTACTLKLQDESSLLPQSIRSAAVVRIWAIVCSQLVGLLPIIFLEFLAVTQYPLDHTLVWWFVLGFPVSCWLDAAFVAHRYRSMHAAIRMRGNKGRKMTLEEQQRESEKRSRMSIPGVRSALRPRSKYGPNGSKYGSKGSKAHPVDLIGELETPTETVSGSRRSVSLSMSHNQRGSGVSNALVSTLPGSAGNSFLSPGLRSSTLSVDGTPELRSRVLGSYDSGERGKSGETSSLLMGLEAVIEAEKESGFLQSIQSGLEMVLPAAALAELEEAARVMTQQKAEEHKDDEKVDSDKATTTIAAASGSPQRTPPRENVPHEPSGLRERGRFISASPVKPGRRDSVSVQSSQGMLLVSQAPANTQDQVKPLGRGYFAESSANSVGSKNDSSTAYGDGDGLEGKAGCCAMPMSVHMMISLLVPFALFLGLLTTIMEMQEVDHVQKVFIETDLHLIEFCNELSHEASKERGLTYVYLNSGGALFEEEMKAARLSTNRRIDDLFEFMESDFTDINLVSREPFVRALYEVYELPRMRERVSEMHVTDSFVMRHYSELITEILTIYMGIASDVEGDIYQNDLIALLQLIVSMELRGDVRALGASAFARGHWQNNKQHARFLSALTEERMHLDYFEHYATKDVHAYWLEAMNHTEINDEVHHMEQVLMHQKNHSIGNIHVFQWYSNYTFVIEELRDVEIFAEHALVHSTQNLQDSNLADLSMLVAALFVCLVMSGFVILSLGAAYGEYKSLEDQALKFNVDEDVRILCCLDPCARRVCGLERLLQYGNFHLLLVAIVCSVACIIAASSELIFDRMTVNEDSKEVQVNAPLMRSLSDFLYASSRERGITGLYVDGHDGEESTKLLRLRRSELDEQLVAFQDFITEYAIHSYDGLLDHESYALLQAEMATLDSHRDEVDTHVEKDAEHAMQYYTTMDGHALDFLGVIVNHATQKDYHSDLAALIAIGFVKNSFGQVRAIGSSNMGIADAWAEPGSKEQFLDAQAECKAHMHVFQGFINAHGLELLEDLMGGAQWVKSMEMQDVLMYGSDSELAALDPVEFFDLMTSILEDVHGLELYLEKDMIHFFKDKNGARVAKWVAWMVVLFALVLVNLVMYDIAVGRTKTLEKLDFYNVMRHRRRAAKQKVSTMKSASNVSRAKGSGKSKNSRGSTKRKGSKNTTASQQSQSLIRASKLESRH